MLSRQMQGAGGEEGTKDIGHALPPAAEASGGSPPLESSMGSESAFVGVAIPRSRSGRLQGRSSFDGAGSAELFGSSQRENFAIGSPWGAPMPYMMRGPASGPRPRRVSALDLHCVGAASAPAPCPT